MEVPLVVVQDLQDMELLVVVLDLQDMEVLLEVEQEDMEVQVVVLDQEGTEALELKGFEVEEMEVLEVEQHFIFPNNVIEIHAMILFNNVEEHHSTLIPL